MNQLYRPKGDRVGSPAAGPHCADCYTPMNCTDHGCRKTMLEREQVKRWRAERLGYFVGDQFVDEKGNPI